MATNLLDQLTQTEVPPPPADIDRQVHRRLNQWLLVAQTADLVVRAFGYAAVHLISAIIGAVQLTLTGSYQTHSNQDTDNGA